MLKTLYQTMKSAAEDKKASHINYFDVSKKSDLCDHHFICYGQNSKHTQALAETIEDRIREEFKTTKPYAREGQQEGRWILLDYGHTIIHVVDTSLKDHYQFEKLWSS